MNYILITSNKSHFLLSEKEKNSVYQAVSNGEKMVIIQGQMISLQIIPEVLEFPRWFEQENIRLTNQRRRLCKKCLGSVLLGDSCSCKDGIRPANALGLPSETINLKLNSPKNERKLLQ